MQITNYVAQAVRTAKVLPTLDANMDHAILGMVTELGELATSVKRAVIYEKGFTADILSNIWEEAGDFIWYVALAIHALDLTVDVCTKIGLGCGEQADHSQVTFGDLVGMLDRGDVAIPTPTDVIKSLNLLITDIVGDGEVEELSVKLVTMLFAVGTLLQPLNLELDDVAAGNIAKLQRRFPDAYSNDAAEARADKGGLDVKNS